LRVTRLLPHLVRPTALVWGGFLVLAGGIVSNALVLQAGRHPAPLFATRQVLEDPAAPQRDELVVAVQDALRNASYYAGPIDGIAGPRTRAAIEKYERAMGRAVNGEVTVDLLAALNARVAAEPDERDATIRPRPPIEPNLRLQAVQRALARAAYGPLPADGVFGPQTRDAIMRFQRDHGLPVTGDFSEALVVELRAAGAFEGE
jgi:peptidoglycan hydrolase-like protein with peptidoglycan-binding domain